VLEKIVLYLNEGIASGKPSSAANSDELRGEVRSLALRQWAVSALLRRRGAVSDMHVGLLRPL
jgi:hypothetical protein